METFLDVLGDGLEGLVEKGLITGDSLYNGIPIFETWIRIPGLPREDLITTFTSYMKRINQSYLFKCERNGKSPDSVKDISISKRGKVVSLLVKGNDGWTEFFIRNFKSDRTNIHQLSPKEFTNMLVENIGSRHRDEKKYRISHEDMSEKLKDMSKNLVDYYEYLLKEKRINEQNNRIKGGVIIQEQSKNEVAKSPNGGVTRERINPEIDFKQRDEFLASMLEPEDLVVEYLMDNSNKDMKPYNAYVYKTKKQEGGAVIVFEPYLGVNNASRIIYLSEHILEKLQGQGQKRDEEFWKSITRYYATESKSDFIHKDGGTTIYHTAADNYEETVGKVVKTIKNGGSNEKISRSSQMRVSRILDKILGNETTPDIRAAVIDNVGLHELGNVENLFTTPTGLDEVLPSIE